MSIKNSGQNKFRITDKTDFLRNVSKKYLRSQNVRKVRFGEKILGTEEIKEKLADMIGQGYKTNSQIMKKLETEKERAGISDRKEIMSALRKKFGEMENEKIRLTKQDAIDLDKAKIPKEYQPKYRPESLKKFIEETAKKLKGNIRAGKESYRLSRGDNGDPLKRLRTEDNWNPGMREIGVENPHQEARVSALERNEYKAHLPTDKKGEIKSSVTTGYPGAASVAGGFGTRLPGKSNVLPGNFGAKKTGGIDAPPVGFKKAA